MASRFDEHKVRKEELNSFSKNLIRRCKSHCELCGKSKSLQVFEVPPVSLPDIDSCSMICAECLEQINNPKKMQVNYWHCLNETAWSEVPAVQVLVWRLLKHLEKNIWAKDLLEQLYLDDDIIAWAKDDGSRDGNLGCVETVDSNGTQLNDGDNVTLIKDLDVKGVAFIAKRGTIVKNITLTSNPEHIEGRVNKTKLVLKTCFLKKS